MLLLALTVGGLFAAGVYLLLRRSIVRPLIGLALISHAANLLVIMASSLPGASPPIVPEGARVPPATAADPLPHALVLTAIVISFALIAFAVVLVHRVAETTGEDDVDELRAPD